MFVIVQFQIVLLGLLLLFVLSLVSFFVGLFLTRKLFTRKRWDEGWWIPFNLNALFFVIRMAMVFFLPVYVPVVRIYLLNFIYAPLLIVLLVNVCLGILIVVKQYDVNVKEASVVILLVVGIIFVIDLIVMVLQGGALFIVLLGSIPKG